MLEFEFFPSVLSFLEFEIFQKCPISKPVLSQQFSILCRLQGKTRQPEFTKIPENGATAIFFVIRVGICIKHARSLMRSSFFVFQGKSMLRRRT